MAKISLDYSLDLDERMQGNLLGKPRPLRSKVLNFWIESSVLTLIIPIQRKY